MKKLFLFIGLMLGFTAQARDLRSLFINMPDSVIPLLSEVNRADFGDFLDSKMKAIVKNKLGEKSEMLVMNDDYLSLRLTTANYVDMRLLEVNDSTSIICMVNTYHTPVEDSSIRFYDTNWCELDSSLYIELPAERDFFVEPVSAEQNDSLASLLLSASMQLQQISLDAKDDLLSIKYTSADFMDKKSSAALKKYLKKTPLMYRWTKEGFKQVEGDIQ